MSEKILVIRLGSLGDIVLTSSTILNLKINYPASRIVFLTKEKFRPLVEMIDGVDEIVGLSDDISAASYFQTLLELDKSNFDKIVDLHGNPRSWLARKTISANERVVYPKRRLERVRAVKGRAFPEAWPHTIDLYNKCVEQLGGRSVSRRPILNPNSSGQEERITNFLLKNPRFVLIAPGAAHPTKQYPIERFVEIGRDLHNQTGAGIIWAATADTGSDSPAGAIDPNSYLQLTDYPIERLANLMSSAILTIANDSGIAHLSSAMGTPVMAIFGPTHPVLGFAPRGLFDRVIEVDEYCRPCSLHGRKECFREERYCFENISVESVVESAVEMIDQFDRTARAVFVDRDGTIIVDKDYLRDPERVELLEGSVAGLRSLQDQGFKIVVVSNQSGVARGFLDIQAVDSVNARMLEMLSAHQVEVDGVYFCPHFADGIVKSYAHECDCRKPAPGMVEEAAHQLGINLRKSFVIGDKLDDVHLGIACGAASLLVRTGYGKRSEVLLDGRSLYRNVTVVDNLLAAAINLQERHSHDKNR